MGAPSMKPVLDAGCGGARASMGGSVYSTKRSSPSMSSLSISLSPLFWM